MAKVNISEIVQAVQQIVPLIELIKGLFKNKAPAPRPTPSGGNTTRLPDDEHIPPPAVVSAAAIKPARVTLRLRQAQFNRDLFPDAYTADNPMGLYRDPMGMVASDNAFNRMSKLWFDLTAFDSNGRELGGNELTAAGLAYVTEHNFVAENGEAFYIRGKGQRPDGAPNEWEQRDGAIGFGSTSWIDSLGCNVAAKAWGEGTFVARGSIGGVDSNPIKFRVS